MSVFTDGHFTNIGDGYNIAINKVDEWSQYIEWDGWRWLIDAIINGIKKLPVTLISKENIQVWDHEMYDAICNVIGKVTCYDPVKISIAHLIRGSWNDSQITFDGDDLGHMGLAVILKKDNGDHSVLCELLIDKKDGFHYKKQ